jgi:hypothetical protein
MQGTTMKASLVAAAFVCILTAEGRAQSWQGSVCWQLDSFADTIRTGLMLLPDGQYALTVKWTHPIYTLSGSGAASSDPIVPGTYRLGFSAAGSSLNHSCDLTASLNIATLSGPWRFECRNGFVNSGSNFHMTSCPAGDAVADEGSGPAIPK